MNDGSRILGKAFCSRPSLRSYPKTRASDFWVLFATFFLIRRGPYATLHMGEKNEEKSHRKSRQTSNAGILVQLLRGCYKIAFPREWQSFRELPKCGSRSYHRPVACGGLE